MTASTAPSVQAVLGAIEEIASELEVAGVLEAVGAIREHNQAPKLQMAIVGSTGSGRSTLANVLLGRPSCCRCRRYQRCRLG